MIHRQGWFALSLLYFSMNEAEYNEAVQLTEALAARVKSLRPNEADFVTQIYNKLKQYGPNTFLSEKQLHWLQLLAKQHTPDPRQTNWLDSI